MADRNENSGKIVTILLLLLLLLLDTYNIRAARRDGDRPKPAGGADNDGVKRKSEVEPSDGCLPFRSNGGGHGRVDNSLNGF